MDSPNVNILPKNYSGGMIHMLNGMHIMLASTAISKRHSALIVIVARPRIIPVGAEFLALSLTINMHYPHDGPSTQRSQITGRMQTLCLTVGPQTTLAGHTHSTMFMTCVPRDAAIAQPFEGLPRQLAVLAIDATPNGTFDKTNSSNITALGTRTTQEAEALGCW